MKNRLLVGFSILLLAVFGTVRASAQVDLSEGVGRISLIHGDVSTQRGDSGDWASAALNQPVVSGDRVSTGAASRTEVQLDYANILRLADNTQATIAGLTRSQIQVQIGQGLADFSVFKGSEANIEIDTPNVAVHPSLKDGVYRIEVNGGETRVIVRKGEAQISTPQGSTTIEKGQSAIVRGTGSDTEYKTADAPGKDSWDSWNNDRDGTIRNAESWRHTNQYYTGAEDLDAYGHWQNVPDYGYVWAPVVPVGWAPYRAGRWVWEPYWGWTWVSYEPWGWAPYHYGRWFLYGGSWVWWPGPVYPYYQPVWAPAYVTFFGFGSNVGFSFGFGFGSVGWLPVGPCDHFYPWYGRYRSRFNVVNITNITIINNNRGRGHWGGFAPLHTGTRYSNLRLASTDARIREGISTLPTDRFGTGQARPAPYSHKGFRDGGMMTGNLPIVPTRQSLSASDRQAAPSTVRGGQPEHFFAKTRPAVAPQPFEKQVAQMRQDIQRNDHFANRPEGRAEAQAGKPAAGMNNPAMSTPRTPAQGPGTRVQPGTGRGQETPAKGVERPEAGLNNAPGGWRRFGTEIAENRPPQKPQQANAKPAPSRNAPAKEAGPATPEQGSWRRFSETPRGGERSTPPAQQPGNRGGRPPDTGNMPSRAPMSGPPAAQPDRNEGWRHFTPQPAPAAAESPNQGNRGSDQWNRFPSRGEAPAVRPPAYGDNRGSRPPLDLRRPIVTPRPPAGMSGPSHGGGAPRPEPRSGGGNRGGSAGGGQPHSSPPSRRR
ncbi:MAG TPA: DUF6600 domain-containing protein [Terriglobales bacterium]|jgi:hypothetical protein|nr:DUF6600 domain-containing protein [Terriglobales bacterium]